MFKTPKGTTDILPEEQKYWSYIRKIACQTAEFFGYERLDTPLIEEAALFWRGVGQGTDITEKEMYVFKDKSGTELALKPEGTAPACRAYLQHGMSSRPQPVRLYYLSPAFRYERPQSGRQRQHHQVGFEAIGDASSSVDAEIIDLAWHFFQALGLHDIFLVLNSIGCSKCRPHYLEVLKTYYIPYKESLCPDCQIRLEKNPLRLLDCKNENCQSIAEKAPRSFDYLCSECKDHFDQLQSYLHAMELPFALNHRLVRGLDYYTRTVFEIQPESEGGQSTLGGGGRYDNLIEDLGGPPTPGVGFAAGIERIILNLKKEEVSVPELPRPLVYIAQNKADKEAILLARNLRENLIGAILATGQKSLKSQLRQANSLRVPYTVIIGEEEIKNGTVILRDMVTSTQETINKDSLIEKVKKLSSEKTSHEQPPSPK